MIIYTIAYVHNELDFVKSWTQKEMLIQGLPQKELNEICNYDEGVVKNLKYFRTDTETGIIKEFETALFKKYQ